MGNRVGLLAGLLVLVLGSGAVAQEASPEARPLYAPHDIGSAVPHRVGSLDLSIRVAGPDGAALGSDPDDRAFWSDFLAARGKEPTDMVAAYGVAMESATDPALAVWAVRVVGIAAEQLIEPTLATSDTDLSNIPPGGHADWRDIDGHNALVLTADDADDWTAYYPNGEVLFIAYGDDRAPVEDVISALSSGAVAQSPSPEATPLYAPDDMALLLPRQVADVPLTVTSADDPGLVFDDHLEDLLLLYAKDREDLRMAVAGSVPDTYGDRPLTIFAIRLDGVPAEAWLDTYLAASLPWDESGSLPENFHLDDAEVGGRDVRVLTVAGGTFTFYPMGEVLFVAAAIGVGAPAIDDVLAELP